MSMNEKGCSTCKPGEEKYEEFGSLITGKTEVQYEFRTDGGSLFTTVKPTLELCRKARDLWLTQR